MTFTLALKSIQHFKVLPARYPRYSTAAISSANATFRNEIEAIKQAGTFKNERVILSSQSSKIAVSSTTGPHSVLNFCANNYLGLSNNPDVIKAAHAALDTHGAGLSSVRFICGTQDLHKNLEKTVAKFHKQEDAILYPSCFDANAGLFEALLTDQDAIISDELNHASIIDGVRLCKAARFRYKNASMQDLEAILQRPEVQQARLRLIATDGVFSMDGNIAPLDKICDLAQKYQALVFVDECHASGFLGKQGRGTPEYFGVEDRIAIVNSTLGKALGGASGGYTAASKEIVSLLRQRSRPYLFSNALPPSVVASGQKVFDMLSSSTSGPKLRANLHNRTHQFRQGMKKAGFTLLGHPDHPIAPVWLGDAKLAATFADKMLEEGIYVVGFSYPVVPKGKARIRVQLSAAHTEEQVNAAIRAFTKIGKELKVI